MLLQGFEVPKTALQSLFLADRHPSSPEATRCYSAMLKKTVVKNSEVSSNTRSRSEVVKSVPYSTQVGNMVSECRQFRVRFPLSLRFPSPRVGNLNRPGSAPITGAGFQSQVGPRDGRLDRSGSARIAVSEPHARCYSESADYDTDAGRSLAVRRTVRRRRRRRRRPQFMEIDAGRRASARRRALIIASGLHEGRP